MAENSGRLSLARREDNPRVADATMPPSDDGSVRRKAHPARCVCTLPWAAARSGGISSAQQQAAHEPMQRVPTTGSRAFAKLSAGSFSPAALLVSPTVVHPCLRDHAFPGGCFVSSGQVFSSLVATSGQYQTNSTHGHGSEAGMPAVLSPYA